MRLITLNRPRQLNVISSKVVCWIHLIHIDFVWVLESILCLSSCFLYCDQVSLLAEYLEKWEKDNKAELVIIKVSLTLSPLEKSELLLVILVCFTLMCYLNKGAFVKAVGDDAFWSSMLFQNGAFSSSAKKHVLRQKKISFCAFCFSPNAKITNFFFIPRFLVS